MSHTRHHRKRVFPELPEGADLRAYVYTLPDGTVTKDYVAAIAARRRGGQVVCTPKPPRQADQQPHSA